MSKLAASSGLLTQMQILTVYPDSKGIVRVVVKLVESKAKLTPLDQKGDAIKAELCRDVFAIHLKTYLEKQCYIKVDRWTHFVDSQTILGAIQKDSYGYQTFFANRIGEIQKVRSVDSWSWVEGKENITDLLTRGASPEELAKGSVWQEGPGFLKLPESDFDFGGRHSQPWSQQEPSPGNGRA